MKKQLFAKTLVSTITLFTLVSTMFIIPQTNQVLAFDCITDLTSSSPAAQKAICEQEVRNLEEEVKKLNVQLEQQKNQSGNLKKDVTALTAQIKKAQLEIVAKNKVLSTLAGQIGQKNTVIKNLDEKKSRQEESLEQILRKKNQLDDSSLAEILLSKNTLSGFLGELDNLQSVNRGIQDSFYVIKDTKEKTNAEKMALEEKKAQENNVKYQLESDKKKVEITQTEKERALTISKGQEKNYEQVISDRKARVAKINARLFELRGQKGIAFGDAYRYAKEASAGTGVRPAFILAILTQESSLGKNVGGCYLTDQTTGAGKRISNGEVIANVMKPSRDIAPFIAITSSLGRDYTTTNVSCPIKSGGGYSGYGGAMGPSQFIPSTWVLYKTKIAAIAGSSQADPWNPEHAIIGTSLLLKDNGAGPQTYTAEINAACKYYSGRSCSGSNQFYGNSVMSIAAKLQTDIDFLDGN
jgi:membrane-bound lytic murein transglycosylase B